jgi:hypothetical protein
VARLLRLLVGLAALLVLLPSTTTAGAAPFAYDSPALTRFDAHASALAEDGQGAPVEAQEGPASPPVEARRTSTTPVARSNATEAAGPLWVETADLMGGERLHELDGSIVTVAGVVSFDGLQTMYDLTVDGVHTYYVEAGDQPVLVHNCGESFGEIVATDHGAQRMAEAGFDQASIQNLEASPNVYEQAGGGMAHVVQTGPDSFDMAVIGDRGVITAHRAMTRWELDGLAANHGWTGYP